VAANEIAATKYLVRLRVEERERLDTALVQEDCVGLHLPLNVAVHLIRTEIRAPRLVILLRPSQAILVAVF
jgi:hypothetical protein